MKNILLIATILFVASCHKTENLKPTYSFKNINWTSIGDTAFHVIFTNDTATFKGDFISPNPTYVHYSVIHSDTIYMPDLNNMRLLITKDSILIISDKLYPYFHFFKG